MLTLHGALLSSVMILALVGPPARADFVQQEQFGQGYTIPMAWGDADGDGDLDLAVGNFQQENALFRGDGTGQFVGEPQFGAGATFAVVWGDLDNDGDADAAVGQGYGQANLLFVNQSDGTFVEQTAFGLGRTIALAWGDYDRDGDLDLAVGNGILGTAEANLLFVNQGDGTFAGEEQFGGGQTGTLVWGDCDADGDLDLAVGNGGFGAPAQNYLYENNGDGTFTERPEFGEGDTACMAWGDADGDGDLDLAVGNWGTSPQNLLFVNTGSGQFEARVAFGDRDTNTLAWGDADNDGDLDLAVGNGDFTSADQNHLYRNQGDGTFTEEAQFGQGSTDAVAWGDVDDDGDLDLAVGNEHSPLQNYLYRNDGSGGFLHVHLVGAFHASGTGFSNRDGIGAHVLIYEAGHLGDRLHLLGMRACEAHGGFSAQNSPGAHFGLGTHTLVDLRILWPGSDGLRIVQDLTGVAANQVLTVTESGVPAGVTNRDAGLQGRLRLHVAPQPMVDRARLVLQGAQAAPQGIAVCDVRGHLVRTFAVRGPCSADAFCVEWDGRTNGGRPAASGIYYVYVTGDAPAPLGRIMRVR